MGMTKIKGLRMAALALLVLALLLAFHWAHALQSARTFTAPSAGMHDRAVPAAFRWPGIESGRWKLFRSGAPVAPQSTTGSLASRYRLAGVFVMLSGSERSGGENRCAILDDLQTKQQILATEDEQIGPIRVVRVENDHVVLSSGAGEENIYLAAGTIGGSEKRAAVGNLNKPAILESNRFGNRIGETRWEYRREAVLEYYQEMMDDPERLAALFMAMEPDRDEAGKVAGYRVNMDVGEKEFYTQMGFQQGDVVRKVNSMRMTSQRRAEYFIGEFVQSRLGAVVIDIEREGQPQKLVYLVK
jgi:type II secretory pathway component PulC